MKTICGKHRTEGYVFNEYWILVCKGCGLEQNQHETNQETWERLNTTEEK